MVGIRDIAKEAGVSISTVSYALNGSPRVSDKTRDKIVEIANKLNYIPNMAGQNLRKQKTDIIAVHIASYQGAFYGDLLQGMHEKATEYGLELIVCSGKRSRLLLPQRMIDGILVIDNTYSDEELLKYAELNYPIVVLDRDLRHENVRSVLLDNTTGTKEAMRSFKEDMIEQVLILSGPKNNFDSQERLAAAMTVARDEEYAVNIVEGNFTAESGYAAASQIQCEEGDRLGIFALNDEMALGAYNYFKEVDGNIGEDIIIKGFDQSEITQFLTPPIHSVSYSQREWGGTGVETLMKLILEEPAENSIIPTYFS